MKPLLVFAVSLLLVCGRAFAGFDAKAEEQKLLKRDAEWAAAATAGKDVEKIASYWTDDAVLIMPGTPTVAGKAALRAFVASCLGTPGFKIQWKSRDVIFSPDGKLAYMRGESEVTAPGTSGAPATSHSRAVTIWRVEKDGEWRCAMDISTEEAPAISEK